MLVQIKRCDLIQDFLPEVSLRKDVKPDASTKELPTPHQVDCLLILVERDPVKHSINLQSDSSIRRNH